MTEKENSETRELLRRIMLLHGKIADSLDRTFLSDLSSILDCIEQLPKDLRMSVHNKISLSYMSDFDSLSRRIRVVEKSSRMLLSQYEDQLV